MSCSTFYVRTKEDSCAAHVFEVLRALRLITEPRLQRHPRAPLGPEAKIGRPPRVAPDGPGSQVGDACVQSRVARRLVRAQHIQAASQQRAMEIANFRFTSAAGRVLRVAYEAVPRREKPTVHRRAAARSRMHHLPCGRGGSGATTLAVPLQPLAETVHVDIDNRRGEQR